MLLIGIDCATDDAKIGLARGRLAEGGLAIEECLVCGRERPAVRLIADWLRSSQGKALLAIDAPLGWPIALGAALATHRAGDEIAVPSNELFRRATDRFIKERLNKQSLDVGADRIARTAHAALRLLGELRRLLDRPIPLAWSPAEPADVAAIEVYPAATLISRGIRSDGYKKPIHVQERRAIISALAPEVRWATDVTTLEQNADVLDAAICTVAAADFQSGRAAVPLNRASAEVEGWIWAPASQDLGANSV